MLSDLVGRAGEVLATDVDTRFVDALERPNVEVREHDIMSDPLPEGRFDLVHARLVVEHLGRRAVERMVPSVAPGGWIVLEDADWGALAAYPDAGGHERTQRATRRHLTRSGLDPQFGRKLVHELERAGLVEVGADARVRAYRGGSPASDWVRLTLESLKPELLDSGAVTAEDIEQVLAETDDPRSFFLSSTMVAAWVRRPE
jgi:Methyltransferase domain